MVPQSTYGSVRGEHTGNIILAIRKYVVNSFS